MRMGAYVGAVVGCLGWLLGLAWICLAAGEISTLLRVALPGLAVSLGIAGILILTTELARAAFGEARELRLLLCGEIVFFVGLLVLLMSHWIGPLVDASPDLKAAVGGLGGAYRTPDVLPTALMAGGTVLFALALARLRRGTASRGA